MMLLVTMMSMMTMMVQSSLWYDDTDENLAPMGRLSGEADLLIINHDDNYQLTIIMMLLVTMMSMMMMMRGLPGRTSSTHSQVTNDS